MSPADARRWASATSLADLGELTALWLEGELGQAPMNFGPPAEETAELTQVLAAVNRAGFVTDCSQPGMNRPWQGSILSWTAPPGSVWCQCAAVSGFASAETCGLLETFVDPELIYGVAGIGAEWPAPTCWNVTKVGAGGDWLEATWFGEPISRTELECQIGPTCSSAAVTALCDARQVTLIDPEWNRNDRLWPLLERFAAAGKRRADYGRG
jgi:hypothetical protein